MLTIALNFELNLNLWLLYRPISYGFLNLSFAFAETSKLKSYSQNSKVLENVGSTLTFLRVF